MTSESTKIQDALLVPLGDEQVVNKPEEAASNTDTSYETSSIVTTSNSSQMPKVRKA